MRLHTKNLIRWENTKNNIDWFSTPEREEALKKLYIDFFNQASQLKSHQFCKQWHKLFENFWTPFTQILESIINIEDESDQRKREEIKKRIFNKFKGNCGEILVEEMFLRGKFSKYNFHNYQPVKDRQHEEFEDTTALDTDDVQVGIQIKNWGKELPLEVWIKADSMYARNIFCIDSTDFEKYRTRPRQYIISFSEKEKSMDMHKEFDTRVKFIGPEDINRMLRTEINMESIFKEIIKELEY